MSAPTVRFAETPSQYLSRHYQGGPVRGYSQQAFVAYFGIGVSTLCTSIVWYHSARLRHFFGYYPSRFMVPVAVGLTMFGEKWAGVHGRRSFLGMDRYDRDWRSLPVGDV